MIEQYAGSLIAAERLYAARLPLGKSTGHDYWQALYHYGYSYNLFKPETACEPM